MESLMLCLPLCGVSSALTYYLYELGNARREASRRATEADKVLTDLLDKSVTMLSQIATIYLAPSVSSRVGSSLGSNAPKPVTKNKNSVSENLTYQNVDPKKTE